MQEIELQNPVTKTIPRDQSDLIEELAYAHETIENLSRYSKDVLESLVEDECEDEAGEVFIHNCKENHFDVQNQFAIEYYKNLKSLIENNEKLISSGFIGDGFVKMNERQKSNLAAFLGCVEEDILEQAMVYVDWLFQSHSQEKRCEIIGFLVDIGKSEENFSLARSLAVISRNRINKANKMMNIGATVNFSDYLLGFELFCDRLKETGFSFETVPSAKREHYDKVYEGEMTALTEVMNAYNTIDRSKIA